MVKALISTFLCLSSISSSGQSKSNAELTLQKTDIVYKNGKLYKNISFEISILNRAGEKYTSVSIPYSRLRKVSKIEAYLKDRDGKIIRDLQKGDVTERSAISDGSLYEDFFVKEFTLRHNSYPYSISYSYQVQEDEFLQIINWIPVIDIGIPTREALLSVEVPNDYKIRFISQYSDDLSVDSTGSFVKYSWKTSFSDLLKPEYFAAPVTGFLPNVTIVPEVFNYSLTGSFKSWPAYGDWHYNLLEGLSDLSPNEKNNILLIISGVSDTREKIRKLYNYLQDNTRYINITIETGGLKPYPASYVSENKYGDCKALSNYFKAVLGFAGIKSYYTKVDAGDLKTQIKKDFPSQQFNHIILAVPLEDDTVWLDCTSKLPFGYLGTFTQGRDVFIIDKNRSRFTRTPALSHEDVHEIRNVVFSQTLPTQAVGSFKNSYRGEEYESLLYLIQQVKEADKPLIFKEHYVEAGFELMDFRLPVPDRDLPEISLTYSAKSNNVYKPYGDFILMNVLPFSVTEFEDPGKRKLPVQINYPVFKTDSLKYQIPIGFTPDTNLLKQVIKSEFGEYSIETTTEANNINIVKNFRINAGSIGKDKYKDFYDFMKKVNDIENKNKIVVTKKN